MVAMGFTLYLLSNFLIYDGGEFSNKALRGWAHLFVQLPAHNERETLISILKEGTGQTSTRALYYLYHSRA